MRCIEACTYKEYTNGPCQNVTGEINAKGRSECAHAEISTGQV